MMGVNLKALVLKASKSGAELEMRIGSPMEGIVLTAKRGIFVQNAAVQIWELASNRIDQDAIFERLLDGLLYGLDEAEQKLIETGGYK